MEILKLLRNHPNNDADEQEELVLAKLVRIFGVNGIEWELFGEDVSLDLFLKASLLNHSCSPNVVLWNTSMSSVETKGKLLRKVVKGEELTICYYNSSFADVNSCLTKEQRKEKLLAQYGFECLCDICKEGNIEDENLRKEFQQMRTNQQLKDEMLKILSQSKFEMGLGKCQQQLEELLAIAKRKEEIAKIVDSYAVFNSLALCWGLSQCIAFVQKDQEAREQATRYNKEFGEWAQIMGPEAVEYKMDLEENYKMIFG